MIDDPEYELANDLYDLRGDCEAQIKRLERALAEYKVVHRLCQGLCGPEKRKKENS